MGIYAGFAQEESKNMSDKILSGVFEKECAVEKCVLTVHAF